MDDVELLREALEALKEPALNTLELQSRIARRLAEAYGGGAPPASAADDERGIDALIPTLPPR